MVTIRRYHLSGRAESPCVPPFGRHPPPGTCRVSLHRIRRESNPAHLARTPKGESVAGVSRYTPPGRSPDPLRMRTRVCHTEATPTNPPGRSSACASQLGPLLPLIS